MKKNIAIVAGGDSSEIVISLKSAFGIKSFIDAEKYTTYIVNIVAKKWEVELPDGGNATIDKNDFSFTHHGEKTVFDFAYITIHGTPGENGILQGYFELLQIPYSTCDVLTSAITSSKFTCNHFLKGFGVKVADAILLRKEDMITEQEVVDKIGLPCFIKPNAGGSSFGTTKVKEKSKIKEAIQFTSSESEEVLIEQFIKGREFTCGMYKTAVKSTVFPITEVISKNEFFDFGAKYNMESEEITPARIPKELSERIKTLTEAIYNILNCSGLVRADYIVTDDDTIYLLEVNITPGMTTTSFIPQQAAAAGLKMKDVMNEIIEDKIG